MLIHKYALNNVELTEPVLDNALRKEKEYLKSIKIDRLLAGFRETAGLSKTAERYTGGWEDAEIAGHTLGHYMTAQAQLFDATRDNDARNSLGNLLLGLADCQAENGYLFAAKEEIFDRLENGENAWVPWYTMHKIMAGLLSVYRYAKLPQALEIVGRLGEWVYYRTQKWSEETRAKVLSVEYGGMNDCLYDLYKETKFTQFLETAEKFDEKDLYRDVTEGKDVLSGKHANTMIPKFVGALNRYIVVGESEKFYLDAAKAFFDTVVDKHTYVIGGNSENEHFREPGALGANRSRCNCETCNTYNMLKLADRLYRITGEHKYMDFYEKAYLNAILGSQNPETGMTTYFQPMQAGYFKVFSKPFENFWCCTGTGMENFTKLNSDVYHVNEKKVYVNLYVASVLHEMNLDVDITQKTSLETFDTTEFTILAMGKSKFTMCYRIPSWSLKKPTVTLNGSAAAVKEENGYLCLEHEWKTGDKVSIRFYPEVRAERLPDAPNSVAFTYGPFALAAGLGNTDMRTETTGVNVTVPVKEAPVRESIVIQKGTVDEWLASIKQNLEKGDGLFFYINGTDADEELVFSPYYKHYKERYGVYFDFVAAKDLSEQAREELDRRNGVAPKEKEEKTVSKKTTSRLFGNRYEKYEAEAAEAEELEETRSKDKAKTNLVAPRPVYSTLPKSTKKEEPEEVPQTSSRMTMSSPRPPQRPIAPARRDDDDDDIPQTSSRMTMSSPRPPQRPIPPVRRDDDEDDIPQTSSRMTMSSPRPPQRPIPPVRRDDDEDDVPQTSSRMTMSSPRPPQRPIPPARRDDDEDDIPQTSSRMTMSSPRPPQRPIPPVRRDEDEEDDVPKTASKMTMSSPRPPKSTLPTPPKKEEAEDVPQTGSRMTMSSPRPPQRPIPVARRDDEEDDIPQTGSRMTMSSPRPPQRPIAPIRRDDEDTEREVTRTTSTRTPISSLRSPLRPILSSEASAEEETPKAITPATPAAEPVEAKAPAPAPVVELSEEEKESIKKKLETELTETLRGSLTEELRTSLKDEVGSQVRVDLRDELRPELTKEVSEELRQELHDGLKDEVSNALRNDLREELKPGLTAEVNEELRKELHDGLKDEVSDKLRSELRDSLKDEIGEEVRTKLCEELRPALTTEVTEKLRGDLTESLKTEVSDKLREEFRENLKEEVSEEVRGTLREELRPVLSNEVTDSLKQELRESLKEGVTKEIREELHESLSAEVTETLRNELHDGLKNEVTETLRGEFRESLKDDVAKEIREELHDGLKEEVTQSLRTELQDGLKNEVTETLRGELRESLKDDVTKEIREELHESLSEEVTKTLREELHDGLKNEVSETLRGELRESLKDEVTKEIHDELHDGLKEEVTNLLRKEIRENMQDEIRAEIKAEIKEETKDDVAKVVMAEEVEAARVQREKAEAREEANREKREAEEQSRRDAEIKREEERLKLEEARNLAQLRAEEEKARQEEIRLKLETEELREKAKLRRAKEYEGKGKRLLRVLIPAILGVIALVLMVIFAAPVSKGIYGVKNGVERFLFNKFPGVARSLGIESGDKIVPVFVSTNQVRGTKLVENPEDFVRSVSPALGYKAFLAELNGLTCLCMEGEGVRVYYPTELTESGMKYVYVENDNTFSMNFWDYDFTNTASLCPKKEVHNSDGREQYVFTYFSPEKTFHILDAQTLKENELEPADAALAKLVTKTGCQELDGNALVSVIANNVSYSFQLPVSGGFAEADYAVQTEVDAAYALTDTGIHYESYVTANGVYLGKVIGEYRLQNRTYVPTEFEFYALSNQTFGAGEEYLFHGVSAEDAKTERHSVTGTNGERILIP